MKSIYLPRDNGRLFGVHPSKDGFVIALGDFDHPGIHLTIATKELTSKGKGWLKIDIHLKNDIIGKWIPIFYFEINKDRLREIIIKKLMRIVKISRYYFNKFEKINIENKNLLCIDCLRESKKFDISTRKKAKQIYGLDYLKELSNFPICNKEEHKTLYDLYSDEVYLKFFNSIISIKDAEKYSKAFENLFRREIQFCQKMFKKVEKKIKEELRKI